MGGPPTAPLNGTDSLVMSREALPLQYTNLSDVVLASWSPLVLKRTSNFINKSQIAKLCTVCLKEFGAAAGFIGKHRYWMYTRKMNMILAFNQQANSPCSL